MKIGLSVAISYEKKFYLCRLTIIVDRYSKTIRVLITYKPVFYNTLQVKYIYYGGIYIK